MQQVESLRGRITEWNPRAQWVQLGLLSASIMTPLIGRWNELRAAERARALREEAEARLRGVRTQLPWPRTDALDPAAELLSRPDGQVIEKLSARGKVSTRLWLVGVGVGLVAAGAGAYILVRRRMERSTEEPLVELPLTSLNGYVTGTGDRLNGSHRVPAASSIARAASPAAAVTPSVPVLTKELTASQPRSQMARSMAQPDPGGEAGDVSARGVDPSEEEGTQVDASQLERAPFIGDIHTMIYHDADDDNLPAEENRIYFMSEEEARAAGYRRDYEI
ncbi:MAG: hypothetical protein ACXWQR_17695 [Ktedonobacterales bacterium]